MKRSDIRPLPAFFDRYILLVDDLEIDEAFAQSVDELGKLDIDLLGKVGSKTYAPGKWTLHDIFQHIIDTERVHSYRALRFARNDQTLLPGFDQDLFAQHTQADRRTLQNLLHECKAVRQSTMALFRSFDEDMLQRKGATSMGGEISVLGFGFTIIGHQLHHLRIIREKYLPLAAG